jgi:hypothetical protein
MHMEIRWKTQGKIPLWRPSKCYDYNTMKLIKTGCDSVKWIELACNILLAVLL